MINSADYTKLISAWLDYIRQEELSDLKIDASDVKDFNLYSFNGSPNFHIDKDSVTIVFDESFYRNNNFVFYPDTESPQGNLQLYLLFPFVEKKQKGSNAVYLPLFVINIDVNLSQLTSMAISPDCSSEKQNSCSIDSNAKESTNQKLLWPKVKLTLSDKTDYIVCGSVFSELLDLDIDILKEHFFTGKPFTVLLQDIIDLISNITGYKIPHSKNLLELLTELKRQLTQAIGKPWFKLHNRFDVILLHSRQDFIETRRIKKQLSILSRQEFIPQEPNSAVYEYLYGRQQFDFETYNTPSNHPWFATFHNYSLSRGQALVLQKLAEGQKLIAVQGPPGTGKTTLLMAVVAQVLTEKALAIARGLTDFPSLILVTSTANKAVENAAREFETSIELKKIPIYEHGGFYLKGGSNKNIESSIAQINTFLDWLKQTTFDEKQYEETKQKLIQSYLDLQKEVTQIEIQSNRYKTVLSQLENIDNKYKGLEKKIETLESEITRMKREFLSYSVEDTLFENNYDLKQKIDEYNQWIEHYKNTPFFKLGIKYTELSLFNSDLKKASIDALTKLNSSLFERIIN
ncbi:MAG: AAA domain-containing protein, partial [Caldanaerobacter sp.]